MLKKLWLSVLLAVCLVGASLTLAQEDLDETLEWERHYLRLPRWLDA
jgi:hypothetical protein